MKFYMQNRCIDFDSVKQSTLLYIRNGNLIMQDDKKNIKQLLNSILQKNPQILPEIVSLRILLDQSSPNNQKSRVIKQIDCMNPQFLIRLSECGQRIKQIMLSLMQQNNIFKEMLKESYKDYMKVIKDIRKYHQSAHQDSYFSEMHKNSTTAKWNLLQQLKIQIKARKKAQSKNAQLYQQFHQEIEKKQQRIKQLEDTISMLPNEYMKISHISTFLVKEGLSILNESRKNNNLKQAQKCEKQKNKFGQLYQDKSILKPDKFSQQFEQQEQYIQENNKYISSQNSQVNINLQQQNENLSKYIEDLEQDLKESQKLNVQQQQLYRQMQLELNKLKKPNFLQNDHNESRNNNNSPNNIQTQIKNDTKMKDKQKTNEVYDEILKFMIAQASTIEQFLQDNQTSGKNDTS